MIVLPKGGAGAFSQLRVMKLKVSFCFVGEIYIDIVKTEPLRRGRCNWANGIQLDKRDLSPLASFRTGNLVTTNRNRVTPEFDSDGKIDSEIGVCIGLRVDSDPDLGGVQHGPVGSFGLTENRFSRLVTQLARDHKDRFFLQFGCGYAEVMISL